MPRVPKTLPAQLRQYYKTAPRPASTYGNDVFNFAADRLGRRNRAMRDLEDLDRYAMEQQARGRYNPDKLNALARQIEADRMLTEMDFDRYLEPRRVAARNYAAGKIADVKKLAAYQRAYNRLNARNLIPDIWTGTGKNRKIGEPIGGDYLDMEPYIKESAGDLGTWQENADLSPDVFLRDINEKEYFPYMGEFERAEFSPRDDEYLDDMFPEDSGPETGFMDECDFWYAQKAVDAWENDNRAHYNRLVRDAVPKFGTTPAMWRDKLGQPQRYR